MSGRSVHTLHSTRSALPVVSNNPIALLTHPDTRRVRANYVVWFRRNWSRISHTSRVIFASILCMCLLQIIVPTVTLSLAHDGSCDVLESLNYFVLIRALLLLPIVIYQHLHPLGRVTPDQVNVLSSNNFTTAATSQSATAPDTHTVNADLQNEQRLQILKRQKYILTVSQWIPRFKKLLDGTFIFLFLFGNYFVLLLGSCARSNNSMALYYGTLVWLLLSYTIVFFPITLSLSVMLCLPCVLQTMHWLHVDDDPDNTLAYLLGKDQTTPSNSLNRRQSHNGVDHHNYEVFMGTHAEQQHFSYIRHLGITEQEREHIPILRYISHPINNNQVFQSPTKSSIALSIIPRETHPILSSPSPAVLSNSNRSDRDYNFDYNHHLTSNLFPRLQPLSRRISSPYQCNNSLDRRTDTYSNGIKHPYSINNEDTRDTIQPIYIANVDDRLCTICLGEYEDNERLRMLRCNHYYHLECIDDWMRISRTCPLCQQDIVPSTSPSSSI